MSDDVDMNEQQTPAQRGFNGALGMRARGVIAAGWALDRAEEVAASVAALTERVDEHLLAHRLDFVTGGLRPDYDDQHVLDPDNDPPPPGADEPARPPQAEGPTITADDALREIEEALYPYVMNERQRPHVRAICVGYARAAALPERSAAAPVTISRDELNRVMGYPKSGHWIDNSSIVIPVLAHFGIKVLPAEIRAYTVGTGVERSEP